MKRLLYIIYSVLICCLCVCCSSTRKAVQTSTEQHITSSTNEDRQTSTKIGEAININQTKTDLTNAVIEFTKTEYFDGTVKVDTTGFANDNEATKPRDRESTEPPNDSRIKSITTGRVILNNEKSESTNTNIEKSAESTSDEHISNDEAEDTQTDIKVEEKPKRGYFYYFGIIISAIIALVLIFFGVRKFRR